MPRRRVIPSSSHPGSPAASVVLAEQSAAPAADGGGTPVPDARVAQDSVPAPDSPPDALAAPPRFPDPIPDVIDFGTVVLFAGAPGVGKTTLFAEWCGRWQSGRSICLQSTNRPTGVCYLSTDRGGYSTRKLLDLHDIDYTYYNPIDDPTFDRRLLRNPVVALDTLRWCLSKLPIQPGNHVVIDPAAPFFVPGSQNDPRSVASLLCELHIICRELQVTIFVLAHFSKQLADDSQRYRRPQDRISGSGAWSGFSDTQMYLLDAEPPEQPYHIFGWNPRHTAPRDYKLLRQGQYFVPYRTLAEVGQPILVPERAYRLFALIPDGGIRTGDLEQAAITEFGISRMSFFRDLRTLEDLKVVSRPHGWIKRVPLEEVQMVPERAGQGRKSE